MDLTDPLIHYVASQMNWFITNRVCGEIAVARSIGDWTMKTLPLNEPLPEHTFFDWPPNHDKVCIYMMVDE